MGLPKDITPVEHAVIAVVVQTAWALLTGDWWAGAAIGTAIFIGREHAQAEYRYVDANGGKRYETPLPPEIGCLRSRYWDVGSILDVVAPAVACVGVAAVVSWALG